MVFLLATLIGFVPIPADPDLWFHLATGSHILQTGSVPHTDPFSFTCNGQPWVPHSWLFDVGVSLIWNGIGPRAAEAGLALVFAFGMLFVYLVLARRGTPPVMAVAVAVALAIAAGNSRGIRPQVFSLALTALLVWRLDLHEVRPSWRLFAWIAPIFLLWAQLHSACVMGVAVVVVWTLARVWDAAVENRWSQRADELAGLAVAAVMAAVCVLATPHTMSHYAYLALTMKLDYLRAYVAEWQAPRALALEMPDVHLYILMAAVLGLLARRARRVGWAELSIFAALALLAFSGARHIPLACVGAAPLLGTLLGRASLRTGHAPQIQAAVVLRTGLALAALMTVFWRLPCGAEERYARSEPVRGAHALAALAGPGAPLHVYTTYNTGAYVLWTAPQRLLVFVDSRADVYGDAILMRAHRAMRGDNWDALFRQYDVDAAVVSRTDPLCRILGERGDWRTLAEDVATQTFVRSDLKMPGLATAD